MSILIVCLVSYIAVAAISLALMATPRMRQHIRELYDGRPMWHAYLFLVLMAFAWPVIAGATIVEPLIRRKRKPV